MTNRSIKIVRALAVGLSISGLITILGVGCGFGFESTGDATSFDQVQQTIGTVEDNGNLSIVAGQKTVATLYFTQVLDNMQSVAGVQNLSTDTRAMFVDKRAAFSEYGSALSVNAPMMLGFTALGAEVCGDLLRDERVAAQANRRIFRQVNFDGATVADAAIDDMIRRMARSFWQRNETPAELALLKAAITETLQLAQDNNTNVTFRGQTFRRGALRTTMLSCSAMISSTDAIQI